VYIPVAVDPKLKDIPIKDSQSSSSGIDRTRRLLLEALESLNLLSAAETSKFSVASAATVLLSDVYPHATITQDMVYTSGVIATNTSIGGLIDGDIREQTVQVLENLKAILMAAGTDLGRVVKVTVILKRVEDLQDVNDIYLRYFPKNIPQPARSCFAVSALPLGALIEIEAVAIR